MSGGQPQIQVGFGIQLLCSIAELVLLKIKKLSHEIKPRHTNTTL